MGLILACKKEEGGTGRSRQLQSPYLQGRAATPAVHFKTNTSRMKTTDIYIRYGQTAPSGQDVLCLPSCSTPLVTQSISRSPRGPKEDFCLSVNMEAASLPYASFTDIYQWYTSALLGSSLPSCSLLLPAFVMEK